MYSCGSSISFCPQKIECICKPAENPCVTEMRDFLANNIGATVLINTNSSTPSSKDNTGVIDTVQNGIVTLTLEQGNYDGLQAVFSICKINEVIILEPAPTP